MIILPAIDLVGGRAVRLYKGDYAQMTVYSEKPPEVAAEFRHSGCKFMHIVDLEGAKDGNTPNFDTVLKIKEAFGGFCEAGGGIRNIKTVEKYIEAGIDRIILGTAAVKNPEFLKQAADKYGGRIAVGVDIKDGFVAVKGWTEKSELDAFLFCERLEQIGIKTIICTDISRDGAMQGTNRELYKELSERLGMNIVASGGVSSIEDVRALKNQGIYGAIIGKAYYTGAISLSDALEAAK